MPLTLRIGAEASGTALLVATVIGSGIMAESLTTDVGMRLLLNQIATILGLGVLILVLMPISGAHINPVVTLASVIRRKMPATQGLSYGVAQVVGATAGTALAAIMFDRDLVEISRNDRLTAGTFVAEVVATAGLIAVILLLVHRGHETAIPLAVPAWIGAGYVFTSSTSFANPAVTIGRIFTDSFTGISPLSGLGFIGAQIVGMFVALVLVIPVITRKREKKNG